jgi:hypothetical protein
MGAKGLEGAGHRISEPIRWHHDTASNQGGTRTTNHHLGSNFFSRQVSSNLPTYVIRHITIYGNITSSMLVMSWQFVADIPVIPLTEILGYRQHLRFLATVEHCKQTIINQHRFPKTKRISCILQVSCLGFVPLYPFDCQ